MAETFRPIIESFPKDGNTWRLDWFGDVFYQRQFRYKQPFIGVTLSQVDMESSKAWSYPGNFTSPVSQIHTAVPVGTLPALAIGSLWQNGTLVSEPEYSQEAFSFQVDKTSTRLIKAGVNEGDQGFILPFNLHPYHKAHTNSYCLQIALSDGRITIIPCMELFRFYFGTSSSLISRMFLPPFETTRLWSKAKIDEAGKAEIDLAKGLSGAVAADVARIAFSSAALYAAKLFTNSLLTSSQSGEKVYPKMVFPFGGKTQLGAKGVWLNSTFLVFQILSCSHRFPFSSLHYTLSKRQTSINSADLSVGVKDHSGAELLTKAKPDNGRLVNDAPDKQLSTKEKRMATRVRFPDLEYKRVLRTDPVKPARLLMRNTGIEPKTLAVADGEGSSGIVPVDMVSMNDARNAKGHPLDKSAFASFVEQYANDLRQQGASVWFVPLSPRQRYPQFSLMPEIVSDQGEIHPLSYIEGEEGVRPRYVSVMIAETLASREAHLLMEGVDGARHGTILKAGLAKEETIDTAWVGRKVMENYSGFG